MKLFNRNEAFDTDRERTCLNCSSQFKGKYCNSCGEKVVEASEKSIKIFFADILNAFTFLDGKFARTFRLMLLKPGFFSKQFALGIRQPYMKPVSLFFVANFIFFLFPFATSNTFSTPLKYQQYMGLYGATAKQMIASRMTNQGITFEKLALRYDAQSTNLAKTLMVIIVLLFAIVLAVINYNQKLYFADHLYLSFEFNAFFIFVNMILLSIGVSVSFIISDWLNTEIRFMNDTFFTRIFAITSAYFLIRSLKIFYDQKWWVTIIKTAAILFGITYVISIYKGILFFLTMWTI